MVSALHVSIKISKFRNNELSRDMKYGWSVWLQELRGLSGSVTVKEFASRSLTQRFAPQ